MLRRVVLYGVLLCVTLVQAAVYTPAEVPNPKDKGQACYVANPDAILADSDVVWLNQCAAHLEQKTHVEMCAVALGSIGDAEAFDFAYELYQRWGIGREGQNTGVLMLFVLDSHDIRIMTGVGMEGILPDARCSQIVHNDMIPAFRAGDYGGGLCLGALRIYEICTNDKAPEELLNTRSVTNRGKYAEEDEDELVLGLIVLIAVVAFVFIILWASPNQGGKGGKGGKHNRHDSDGGGPIFISGGGFGGGGGFSGGSWGGGSTFGGGAGGKW